jgi:hypothetical protein
MTTTFEAGRVRPLFRLGSYDGMVSGVGLLDGRHVYLDAGEQMGGWALRPKWRALEDLLDELLDDEDSENLWDRIERKYDEKMHEVLPRRFAVSALSDEQFERLVARHRLFQVHVGLHCDFVYDDEGCPRYARDGYWGLGHPYIKAHYYDAVPPRDLDTDALPLLGHVDGPDLYAPGTVRPAFPADPRSPELKAYQQAWKEGDPVRLDW